MKRSGLSNVILLLAAGVLTAFVVLGNAFSSPDGYVSPDSASYLRLAERVLSGHGITVPSDGRIGPDEVWFAIWPPGYSLIIAVISALTGISTLLASKIANIALLATVLILLFRFLGRDGLIAGSVLLSAGTLQIFSMTWSEAPFLAATIALCLGMAAVAQGEWTVSWRRTLMLALLMVLPFTFRYIGMFVFAPVGLTVLYLLTTHRRDEAGRLVISSVIALAVCLAYLWINQIQTGHLTGIERIPAPESHARLLETFLISAIGEVILPLIHLRSGAVLEALLLLTWLVMIVRLRGQLKRTVRQKPDHRSKTYSLYFAGFGTVYLVSIAAMRWHSHFDPFSFRLLDPGFSLLFIGGIIWLISIYRSSEKALSTFFIATALLSVSLHAFQILGRGGFEAYTTQINQAAERYQALPDNAIVVFGANDLRYLRPDIQIAYPEFRPYRSNDEDWQAFLDSLQSGHPIFIQTGQRARNPSRFSESVREVVKNLLPDQLIKITE